MAGIDPRQFMKSLKVMDDVEKYDEIKGNGGNSEMRAKLDEISRVQPTQAPLHESISNSQPQAETNDDINMNAVNRDKIQKAREIGKLPSYILDAMESKPLDFQKARQKMMTENMPDISKTNEMEERLNKVTRNASKNLYREEEPITQNTANNLNIDEIVKNAIRNNIQELVAEELENRLVEKNLDKNMKIIIGNTVYVAKLIKQGKVK